MDLQIQIAQIHAAAVDLRVQIQQVLAEGPADPQIHRSNRCWHAMGPQEQLLSKIFGSSRQLSS